MRYWIVLMVIVLLAVAAVADEVIVSYSDDSLPVLNDALRRLRTDTNKRSEIFSDTGAPTTTPTRIGNIYCRTDTGKVYISTGTSASSDWKLLN